VRVVFFWFADECYVFPRSVRADLRPADPERSPPCRLPEGPSGPSIHGCMTHRPPRPSRTPPWCQSPESEGGVLWVVRYRPFWVVIYQRPCTFLKSRKIYFEKIWRGWERARWIDLRIRDRTFALGFGIRKFLRGFPSIIRVVFNRVRQKSGQKLVAFAIESKSQAGVFLSNCSDVCESRRLGGGTLGSCVGNQGRIGLAAAWQWSFWG